LATKLTAAVSILCFAHITPAELGDML